MTRTQTHALRFALTAFCLLGFGGVGVSATEVGANGGYGASGYRYSIGACNTTTQHTRRTTSQHYGGHILVDLPGDEVSVGARAGVTISGNEDRTVTTKTEEDPATGEVISTTTDTDRTFRADYRLHVVPQMGIHLQYLDLVGGVGISASVAGEPNPDHVVLPAMNYEARLGRLGIVAYYARGEFLGLNPSDFTIVNGVALLGGDLPSVHLAFRLGLHETLLLVAPVPSVEVGLAFPRHWPVRLGVVGALGRHPGFDELSWDVQAQLSVVFGKRPKQSELRGFGPVVREPEY